MSLNSFRELLLKKADGHIKDLFSVIRDDLLADLVLESLEKTKKHKNAGKKTNSMATVWSKLSSAKDAHMLRDAVGHHVSHYQAARKAEEGAKGKGMSMAAEDHGNKANKHLKQLMHLAHIAHKTSGNGTMTFDSIPTHSWEKNEVGNNNRKGWAKNYSDAASSKYRYLEGDPHSSDIANPKASVKLKGNHSAYPFEKMQVGVVHPSTGEIDNKYIHIDHEVESDGKYSPHEFDNHPLMQLTQASGNKGGHRFGIKEEHFGDHGADDKKSHLDSFHSEMKDWISDKAGHFKSWIGKQREAQDKDPAAYKARGEKPSNPLTDFKGATAQPEAVSKPAAAQSNPELDKLRDHFKGSGQAVPPDDQLSAMLTYMNKGK